MEEKSERCTPHERNNYVLCPEVDPEWIQYHLCEQVGDGEENVQVGHCGYALFLAAPEKDTLHVEPKKGNGYASAEKDHEHAL